MAGDALTGPATPTERMAVTEMRTTAGVVTHTTLALGVTRFAWHSARDCGDGLLVDITAAGPRWCDVADVVLWPTPVDPHTVLARSAYPDATLAVFAHRPARWLIVTPACVTAPAVGTPNVRSWAAVHPTDETALSPAPVVTGQVMVCAADWSNLLEKVVQRYRAIVSGRKHTQVAALSHAVAKEETRERMRSARGSSTIS